MNIFILILSNNQFNYTNIYKITLNVQLIDSIINYN